MIDCPKAEGVAGAKRRLQVEQAVSEQADAITQLAGLIEALKSRLEPALRAEPSADRGGRGENKALVQIAAAIVVNTGSINALAFDLSDIIDRLEI